ncbi:Hypothetical protein PP7435_CHR1-1383 [Komagataella phaffii CBS 7435]|uniref:Uncharacterized protein n=2 Tax=Komagataella phaffii TaxID=460519 RepID=C4QYW1_KOMPG|nr:Hypothetical protein PAS_chr1-4_0578 [Komagataella phaffii GS115]AOA61839.1 GQ67_01564T0 [Komagataella phaffii]CAH2447262.1 Hypothetical protein BQ9382_C1-7250 [Komagataella phaffii CBS 7435]AOA66240.1 GQ68_01580T0 [Komagataella phaffii GS115]CAY68435.1 Hypothetical protein PAS_chr1-4_0578 [Komagataella phaffii GS115]CCA37500.1 Hypothetical protein PP7435_CHR1-1383 [Komagataella phaffii CBS 7435]
MLRRVARCTMGGGHLSSRYFFRSLNVQMGTQSSIVHLKQSAQDYINLFSSPNSSVLQLSTVDSSGISQLLVNLLVLEEYDLSDRLSKAVFQSDFYQLDNDSLLLLIKIIEKYERPLQQKLELFKHILSKLSEQSGADIDAELNVQQELLNTTTRLIEEEEALGLELTNFLLALPRTSLISSVLLHALTIQNHYRHAFILIDNCIHENVPLNRFTLDNYCYHVARQGLLDPLVYMIRLIEGTSYLRINSQLIRLLLTQALEHGRIDLVEKWWLKYIVRSRRSVFLGENVLKNIVYLASEYGANKLIIRVKRFLHLQNPVLLASYDWRRLLGISLFEADMLRCGTTSANYLFYKLELNNMNIRAVELPNLQTQLASTDILDDSTKIANLIYNSKREEICRPLLLSLVIALINQHKGGAALDLLDQWYAHSKDVEKDEEVCFYHLRALLSVGDKDRVMECLETQFNNVTLSPRLYYLISAELEGSPVEFHLQRLKDRAAKDSTWVQTASIG